MKTEEAKKKIREIRGNKEHLKNGYDLYIYDNVLDNIENFISDSKNEIKHFEIFHIVPDKNGEICVEYKSEYLNLNIEFYFNINDTLDIYLFREDECLFEYMNKPLDFDYFEEILSKLVF